MLGDPNPSLVRLRPPRVGLLSEKGDHGHVGKEDQL